MSGVTPLGNSYYVTASTTAANIAIGPNISNTFRITNLGTSAAYVAVYNSATQATAFVKPGASNPIVPGAVAINAGWPENVAGNFGAQNTNTIYVCYASDGSSNALVITPVLD